MGRREAPKTRYDVVTNLWFYIRLLLDPQRRGVTLTQIVKTENFSERAERNNKCFFHFWNQFFFLFGLGEIIEEDRTD
ncbi:hypothetical protein LINGRAHAP2_LOCUS9180 [Linum grandiflorum]